MGETNTPEKQENLNDLVIDKTVYSVTPVKAKQWLKILYGSKGDMAEAMTTIAHHNVLVNGQKQIIEFYEDLPAKTFNQIMERLEVF